MRPTASGLLFRSVRLLVVITMILGFFAACMAGLEGLKGSAPAPQAPGARR
ncbi:MAG: hypothetical protein VKJ05_00260 [Synechococcaceae cyanobacterium]|nr:hypothetical protein [Synechococcaceae cyanobacterium]